MFFQVYPQHSEEAQSCGRLPCVRLFHRRLAGLKQQLFGNGKLLTLQSQIKISTSFINYKIFFECLSHSGQCLGTNLATILSSYDGYQFFDRDQTLQSTKRIAIGIILCGKD